MISIISLVLSIISLIMSIYNFWKEMMHLKIEVSDIIIDKDDVTDVAMVRCIISNQSKNQINIHGIDLVDNGISHISLEQSVFICTIGVEIFNQKTEWRENSIQLPLKLNSYDSAVTTLIFPIPQKLELSNKSKIIFKTSRGKKKVNLNKNENYRDNRTNH